MITGVEHTDFTIYPIVDWVAGGDRLDRLNKGIKAHTMASEAMIKFMDKLLK